MKYYGDNNKKALKMVAYTIDDATIYFIKKKGMFMEYMLNVCKTDDNETEYPVVYERSVDSYKVKNFRNEKYYIQRRIDDGVKGTNHYYIYKEVDRIYNAKGFVWRDNKKYGAKETTYISGNFEFFIIAKPDGDAHIEVRYTKCDNKHRNKVTISTIEVYNASTMEIKNAIDEWKRNMTGELMAA